MKPFFRFHKGQQIFWKEINKIGDFTGKMSSDYNDLIKYHVKSYKDFIVITDKVKGN